VPAPPPDARSLAAEVTSVEPCGTDAVLLRVRPEREQPPLRPARFFMLRREDGASPAIPRPFSLYRQTAGELEFLIKVVGRATRALAACAAGQALRLIGPLGNGWPTLDGDGAPWVMLAGGIGSAPFHMAIERALAGADGAPPPSPEHLTLLFGAAGAGALYDLERLRTLGARVLTATEDGSRGFHGNVLGLLRSEWERGGLPRDVRLLACGPDPMLRATERLARELELPCWLSLEGLMGCGVGICNGCPVPTRPEGPLAAWPNAKICVEGPVFALDAITLQ